MKYGNSNSGGGKGKFDDCRKAQAGEAYPGSVPTLPEFESSEGGPGNEKSTGPMPGNYVPNPKGSKDDMKA